MLALGLTALVLTILAMAIHVHLRVAESGRAGVEEAQLARALLQRIAQDLRGSIHYAPVDLTKLVPSTSSSAPSSATPPPGANTATPPTPATPTGTTTPESSTTESTQAQLVPILTGTLTRLEVDFSYVPRSDEFQTLLTLNADSGGVDRPSEMRTVAYFLAEEQNGVVAADAGERHGLVRREMDRLTTRSASEQGQLFQMEQELEPIAPEVTAVEFRYYDGTEWLEEWDSQEQGSLPTAVEITLWIARAPRTGGMFGSWDSSAAASTQDVEPGMYHLIVRLPAASAAAQSGSSQSMGQSDTSGTQQSDTNGEIK